MVKSVQLFFLLFLFTSCHNSDVKKNLSKEGNLCEQIPTDSLLQLKGVVSVTSNDTIILENVRQDDESFRKICLIPGSDEVKKYTLKAFDSFLYMKSFDEKFG